MPDISVVSPDGRAEFQSFVRGADEAGHAAFSVELLGDPILYGEWRPSWAPDKKNFNVEIVGFGWTDLGNVGNPHPHARLSVPFTKEAIIKSLVVRLFADKYARSDLPPFSSIGASFLGEVSFAGNWIIVGQ